MLFVGTPLLVVFFFFNDTATTEIYTLSLHDALPISRQAGPRRRLPGRSRGGGHFHFRHRLHGEGTLAGDRSRIRSEEHTSELQSRLHLVCRLLLEKKKNKLTHTPPGRTTEYRTNRQT